MNPWFDYIPSEFLEIQNRSILESSPLQFADSLRSCFNIKRGQSLPSCSGYSSKKNFIPEANQKDYSSASRKSTICCITTQSCAHRNSFMLNESAQCGEGRGNPASAGRKALGSNYRVGFRYSIPGAFQKSFFWDKQWLFLRHHKAGMGTYRFPNFHLISVFPVLEVNVKTVDFGVWEANHLWEGVWHKNKGLLACALVGNAIFKNSQWNQFSCQKL